MNRSGATVTFDSDGNVYMEGGGVETNGTYEINTDDSVIVCELYIVNKEATMKIPYEYDGENIKLYNDRGEFFEKN